MEDWIKGFHEQHMQGKRAKHPTIPAYAIPKSKFNDSTANGLTNWIISYVKTLKGHTAYIARINVQGQYREKLGKWTTSGSTKYVPDIVGVVDDRSIWVEVKVGRDALSEGQRLAKYNIEQAGGLFYEAKNMQGFVKWFGQNFPSK